MQLCTHKSELKIEANQQPRTGHGEVGMAGQDNEVATMPVRMEAARATMVREAARCSKMGEVMPVESCADARRSS